MQGGPFKGNIFPFAFVVESCGILVLYIIYYHILTTNIGDNECFNVVTLK